MNQSETTFVFLPRNTEFERNIAIRNSAVLIIATISLLSDKTEILLYTLPAIFGYLASKWGVTPQGKLTFKNSKIVFKSRHKTWSIPYSRISHISRCECYTSPITSETSEIHIYTNDNDSYSFPGSYLTNSTIVEVQSEIDKRKIIE